MKLNANGIDINYEIEGEGPVVTFSHSLACNLSMWDEQVRALRGRYRVLRYDTRGHGQTSAPAGAYTLDQLANDRMAYKLYEVIAEHTTRNARALFGLTPA